MNKDRVKGSIDKVVGSAKREAGEWGGDIELQVEGLVQEVKGEIESTWGKVKDAVHDANKEAAIHHDTRVKVELKCAAINDQREKHK